MILICGSLADTVTELVCARLLDCGYPYLLLDLDRSSACYEVTARMHGDRPRGYISDGTWRVHLDDISGVFVRLHWQGRNRGPTNHGSTSARAINLERHAALIMLVDRLACPVINRQLSGMSNYSKPYQALVIRECNLLTPPTMVTNDPDAARRFIDHAPGDVICKALSGEGSIVRRIEAHHVERLESLRDGPAQFQHRIYGENIRVHTVGERLFATLIRSESVDYRHPLNDDRAIEMEPTVLPKRVEAGCLRLVETLGLTLAGIDLMRTASDDYYCFEANPAPAFLFYERLGGQEISLAVANLLQSGSGPGSVKDA